MGRGAGKSA